MKLLSVFFATAVAVILITGTGLAESTPADGRNKFDGLWVGKGKVHDDAGPGYQCTGSGEIPIAFYVLDGVAKSMFQQEGVDFETEVKSNGRIKFKYENLASSNQSEGNRSSVPIHFTGKLKGTKGKGSLSFSLCSGRWEVTKQN